MSDERAGPILPPTTKIDKTEIIEGLLRKLTTTIDDLKVTVDERFDRVVTTVDMLVEDGKTSNMRMTKLELRLDGYEQRAETNSLRVRQSSEVDLKHETAIGTIASDVTVVKGEIEEFRKELKVNSESTEVIKKAVTNVMSSPQVKALGWALWLALTAWLTTKGIKVGQ